MSTQPEKQLKPEQETAAHTLDRHVSVTAGPGSGKTTILVERYLHILRENKELNIDQIVAITFTNRAANEMRERLRAGLDRILRACSGDERRRWMRYKRTLDGAIINTIHGFCARLLREFPVEARIDPQFLLLDAHDAAILLEAAVEEALTEFLSSERDLISRLALGTGRGKLAEALVKLYWDVRGQGLKLEELGQRTQASHAGADLLREALVDLDSTMNELLRLGRLSLAAEGKRSYARSNWPELRQLIATERPSLADYCSAIEEFRLRARMTKSGAVTQIVSRLDEQLWGEDKKGPLGLVPQICFDLHARDYALEVIHVLKEVEHRYREKKQNLAALDFDDLQLRALELLDQQAVLARATERYRFFLVDEFQDTNSVQRELMHKLVLGVAAARANLFIVGDRKQSIYGFRGADVDVFQQTTQALKAAGGIEQPLNLNFRSQPALINFFNHLFARLFRDEGTNNEELAGLGFVEFEASKAQRDKTDAGPLVELLIDTRAPAEEDPKAQRTQAERDARQVVQRIISLTGSAGVRGPRPGSPAGVLDPPSSSGAFIRDAIGLSNRGLAEISGEGGRDARAPSGTLIPHAIELRNPASVEISGEGGRDARAPSDSTFNYRDIALLFRAMTDVPTYETVFRNANIPFRTVQGKGFYDREEISDLVQLLRFLDNKTDELALAAVLRSPLGGISDNALLALRCAPRVNEGEQENKLRHFNQPRKLFAALRRHAAIAYISAEEHEQLDRAAGLLSKLIERRNHYPIADLLRFAVNESEYMTVIAATFDGAQRLANVQKLFTLADRFERSGSHLIRDFVRYVEEFEAIGSRESEGQIDDSADAVRLMTIHQAKGLEFPVVIIPNLHHRSLKPNEYWYALDRHRGLTLKIPDGRGKQVAGCTFERFRERARLRDHFESVRLLYVAATRARDRLVLAGVTNELTKLNGSADNWLKLIWQNLDLHLSKSGIIDLSEDTQLAVTLNLADQSIPTAALFKPVDEEQETEVAGSLTGAFPLLREIAEPESATKGRLHRVSVTQLINYRRCPRQYYFDRLLHVPSAESLAVWNDAEAPEPPANLTATLKGAVIHRFCETFCLGDDPKARLRESFRDLIRVRQAQLADRLQEIDEENAVAELLPLAENYLASSVFKRVEGAGRFTGQGKHTIPQSAESGPRTGRAAGLSGRNPQFEPGLWSELSFRLRRPQGILTGAIDKLLITPASDGSLDIEIIDFKTNRIRIPGSDRSKASLAKAQAASLGPRASRPPTRVTRMGDGQQIPFDFGPAETSRAFSENDRTQSPTLQHEVARVAADYQLQMQAYALAAHELLPCLANENNRLTVTLHFLDPNVEYNLPPVLLDSVTCARAIDEAVAEIGSARAPENFPVLLADHCRVCNFLELCGAGREWLRQKGRRGL